MTSANSAQTDDRFLSNAMASFIQIGVLLILVMLCYSIVAPFVTIMVWGLINIEVATRLDLRCGYTTSQGAMVMTSHGKIAWQSRY